MNFLRPSEELRLLKLPKPLLDDLVIRLPLKAGLSPGEVADLEVTDCCWEYNVLYVWRSKVSRDRPVIIDPTTMFKLYQYVDTRKKGPLFPFKGSIDMKTQTIRRMVKRWARKAGLARWNRVTPYTLRHTFCINWVLGRGTLEGLRRQIGHRNLQKLQHYLDFDYHLVHQEHLRIFGGAIGSTAFRWTLPKCVPYIV